VSEQNISLEEKDKPTIDKKEEEVVIVPRVTLNYIVIAITFLLVGIAIGLFGLDTGKDDTSVTIDEDQLRSVMISVLADSDLVLGGGGTPVEDNSRFELVDDDPYLGDEDAPVVIIEFSDFFCSFCKRHYDQTLTPILDNYGQYIRYVYRDYAQLTPESFPAAMAAQCGHEQGAFWDFHKEFFDNQQNLGRDYYIATAEKLGLDVEQYTACLDENRYEDEVQLDIFDGQFKGVRGTPGFFINGTFLSGALPYTFFERAIKQELDKANISYDLTDDTDTTEETAEDQSIDDSDQEPGRPEAESTSEVTDDSEQDADT
jgi:protein-disulfide isomerase